MKGLKLLFFSVLVFLLHSTKVNAQGNTCPGTPFCTAVGTPYSYSNVHNGSSGNITGVSYGCLGAEPDPSYFYIKTSAAGTMTYSITQGTTVGANNLDVDFIVWGPYTTTTFTNGSACNNLTGSCTGDHACNGNIEDCSFSAAASETMTIISPGAGSYYIIMITNYTGVTSPPGTAGFITFTQTGGPPSDCSITCPPTTINMLAQDTTNYYNGTATYMPNGATTQCSLPFFVWPNQPAFSDPNTDILTPCIAADFNPFNTNENTNGSMVEYEAGSPLYDLCNGCPQGTIGLGVGTTGNELTDYLGWQDTTQAHTFVFCNTSTVGSTVVTLKNCWDGTIYAGPVTWNTTVASCFTLTVPAIKTIGSAVYTITPVGGGVGVYDYHDGFAYVDPTLMPAGTYTLTYIFHGRNGCAAGIGKYVFTVPTKPVVTITPSATTICSGNSTTLTGGGANTYTWSPGGATGSGHTVSPTTTTSYTVIGTNTGTGCKNTATATVTVVATPTVTISGIKSICSGQSTTLTGATASTYSWSVGSASNSISVSPSSNTTYTLVGTNGGVCSATAIATVTVTPTPTLTISGTTVLCTGQSTTLTGATATGYTWSTGATTNTITVTPPTGTTTYTLSGSNGGACTATKTVSVVVTATPTITITGTTNLCSGQSTTLTGATAAGYTWSTGATTNTISVTPPTGNTTYTLTGANGACTATKTVSVVVTATPIITITGTTNLCSGQSTTLTGATAVGYTWNPGGITTNTISVSPGTGTTTYTLTGANGTCTATTTANVNVTATPTVTITGNTNICSGSSTILTGATATSYSWSPGGATTNTITVSPGVGTTTYTLTGHNNVCSSSAIATVSVTATPTITISGNAAICSGQSEVLTGATATNFTWSPGGLTTNTITVNPNATTTYTLTGANGTCTSTAIASLSVTPTPTITITGAAPICNGQSLVLTGQTATSYTWTGGISTNTLTVNPTTTSNYTLTGANGTCTTSAVATVIVNPLPVVTGSVVTAAPCGQTTGCITSVSVSNGTPSYQYSWTGGPPWSASSNFCNIAAGTYPLQVQDANGCISSANISVPSANGPTAPTAAASATSTCLGDSAIFAVNPTVANTTYTWTDITGTHTGATYTVTNITPPGTYNVSVTATDISGCLSTATTLTITVNQLPPTSVSGTSHFCKGTSTVLNASPSGVGYNYQWSQGGTPIGGATSATYTANAAGNYAVVITDIATGCKAASAGNYTVTIDSLPKIDTTSMVVTNSSCSSSTGSVISVTVNPSAGNAYSWTNSSSTVVGTSINLSNVPAGNYCLLVTTNPTSCRDSICGVTINNAGAPPVPTLTTPNNTYCQGQTQSAIIVSGTGTFSWYSDPGLTTQIATGTTYTPNVIVTTTVYVTATNGGCQSASLPIVITINPNPTGPIISGVVPNPLNECQGSTAQSVVVATTGTVTSVPIWYNGTIYVTTGTSYTPSTATPGTTVYTIIDSATVTGCKDLSAGNVLTVTVTINPTPTGPIISGSATNPLNECQGSTAQSVIVATTGTVTSVPVWYNGITYVTTGTSYTPSTATPGTTIYTIIDSATVGGCTSAVTGNVLTVTVTINPTPTGPTLSGSATNPLIECKGSTAQSVSVTTSGTVTSVPIWYNGATYVSTGTSYTPSTATAGTTVYTIADSATVGGCKDLSAGNVLTVTVTINPNPTITGVPTIDSSKCGANNGDVLGLSATGGTPGYIYQWIDGSGAAVGNAANLNPIGPGSYSLIVTDVNGCKDTSNTSFNVFGTSTIHASFTPSANTGQAPLNVVFTNTSIGAANYVWTFDNSTATSSASNPVYSYTTNGTYTVTLIASNGLCIDTAYAVITVDIPTTIIIPNIFSPNGDGLNDEFIITCTGMKTLNCDIFNRWGQLVYTLTGPNQNWDGKLNNGNQATEGTYYYMLNAVGIDGKTYTYQGPLTLVK